MDEIKLIRGLQVVDLKPHFKSDEHLLHCEINSELPEGLTFSSEDCSILGIPTKDVFNHLTNITIQSTVRNYEEIILISVVTEDPNSKILYKAWETSELCNTNMLYDLQINSYPDLVHLRDYVDELFFDSTSLFWSLFTSDHLIQFSGYIYLPRAGDYLFYVETNSEYHFVINNNSSVESTKCEYSYNNVSIHIDSSKYVPFVLFYHHTIATSSSSLPPMLKVIFSSQIYPRKIPITQFFHEIQVPKYLQYPTIKLNILTNEIINFKPYIHNTSPTLSYSIYPSLPSGILIDSKSGTISGCVTISSSIYDNNIVEYTIYANSREGSTKYIFTLQIMNNLPNGLLFKLYEISTLKQCENDKENTNLLTDLSLYKPSITITGENIKYYNKDNIYEKWGDISIYDHFISVWEGKIEFTSIGKWMLFLYSNDQSYVYLNNELIISKSTCSNEIEDPISYTLYVDNMNKRMDIKVVYIQVEESHYIELLWQSNNVALSTIPKSAFTYYPIYSFDYKYINMIYQYNMTIPQNEPNLIGIVSSSTVKYSISPELPDGLKLNPQNGIISGITKNTMDKVIYTVTCIVNNNDIILTTTISITILDNENPYFGFYSLDNKQITNVSCTVGIDFPTIVIRNYNTINYYYSSNILQGLELNPITGRITGKVLETKYTNYELIICGYNNYGESCQNLNITIETCTKTPFILELSNIQFSTNNNTLLLITYSPDGSAIFEESISETNLLSSHSYMICTTTVGPHTFFIRNSKSASIFDYTIHYLSNDVIDQDTVTVETKTISFIISKISLSIIYSYADIHVSVFESFITTPVITTNTILSITTEPILPNGITISERDGSISGIPTIAQNRKSYIITICGFEGCVETRILITITGCFMNEYYFTFNILEGPRQTVVLESNDNVKLINSVLLSPPYSQSFCSSTNTYKLSFQTPTTNEITVFGIKDENNNQLFKYEYEDRSSASISFSTNFIISPQSSWKYFYTNDEIDSNWMIPKYNDLSWTTGIYNNYPLFTTHSQYYRYSFNNIMMNEDLNNNIILDIGIKMNSCFIMYINGYEIFRYNILSGNECNSDNFKDNNDYITFSVLSSFLINGGTNVIAVELHQNPLVIPTTESPPTIYDFYMSYIKGNFTSRSGLYTISSSIVQSTSKDDPHFIISKDPEDEYYTTEAEPKICFRRSDSHFEIITSYKITTGKNDDSIPKSWKFYGSNVDNINCQDWSNNNKWVLLDSKSGESLDINMEYIYTFINTVAYLHYSFEFIETKNDVNGISIGSIELFTKIIDLSNDYCIESDWSIVKKNQLSKGKCPDGYIGYTTRLCDSNSKLNSIDMSNCIYNPPTSLSYPQDYYDLEIYDEINPSIKPNYEIVENGVFTIEPDISEIDLVFNTNNGMISGTPKKYKTQSYTVTYSNSGGKIVSFITLHVNIMNKCNPPENDKNGFNWGYTKQGENSVVNCPSGYIGNITRLCLKREDNSSVLTPPVYDEPVSHCITEKPSYFYYEPNEFEILEQVYTSNLIVPTYFALDSVFTCDNNDLPDGLTVDSKTGIITGTPTTSINAKMFFITVTNDGGSLKTNVTITIKKQPKFEYDVYDLFCKIGNDCVLTATKITPFDQPFTITDDLPEEGIYFDKETGNFKINGTTPVYFGTEVKVTIQSYTVSRFISIHRIYIIILLLFK